jgi:hypothetical protein
VDRLTIAYTSSPLLFWTVGSLLAFVLGTNLLWLTRSISVRRTSYGRAFEQAGRFVFFLGIPYLVLGGWPRRPFQGLLSLEDLGLVGVNPRWPATRWLDAAGTAVGLGLVAFLVLALAWTNVHRGSPDSRLRFLPRPWGVILVDVLYLQVHWAFYRSALAVTLGDLYPGVFLGLGLIYLEWSLNPFWRQGWQSESQAAVRWLEAALALLVALLFLLTRNLWACLAVHLILELAFRRLWSGPAATQAG